MKYTHLISKQGSIQLEHATQLQVYLEILKSKLKQSQLNFQKVNDALYYLFENI